MFTNLFLSTLFLSAIVTLWRIFSRESFVKSRIEALPYFMRKLLTCGVCFTFWLSFFFNFAFLPIGGWVPPIFYAVSGTAFTILQFFVSWMITGMATVAIYYTFLVFYEGSHYLAHKAEEMHE
ncbi:MAG: hypothetical protein FJY91_01480 [Candidatus Harrisonbacteria bacterium]|nr:hypothetical protein [Candidatus Harrisonbacteria bacterium]